VPPVPVQHPQGQALRRRPLRGRVPGVGIATKQGDFWMVDVTFDAFCDATDTLGAFYAD
jgi:hypothetical protein